MHPFWLCFYSPTGDGEIGLFLLRTPLSSTPLQVWIHPKRSVPCFPSSKGARCSGLSRSRFATTVEHAKILLWIGQVVFVFVYCFFFFFLSLQRGLTRRIYEAFWCVRACVCERVFFVPHEKKKSYRPYKGEWKIKQEGTNLLQRVV